MKNKEYTRKYEEGNLIDFLIDTGEVRMNEITNEQKAKNAIKWIENLPNYKQAKRGNRGSLGNECDGYCCLGAGCEILEIPFDPLDINSDCFKKAVGLKHKDGDLNTDRENEFYGERYLVRVNDNTNAGFKRISKLLKKHTDWMFENEVAKIITKHFN